jgi:hypothetical protein
MIQTLSLNGPPAEFRARLLALLLAASMPFSSAGCQQSSSRADHEHEEAHQLPPHRPASFTAAAPDLRQRLTALASDAPTVNAQRQVQVQELKDILRWLPELAGDTDLRKSDWEQVNACARELKQLVAPLGTDSTSHNFPLAECLQIVDRLQSLADKLQSN